MCRQGDDDFHVDGLISSRRVDYEAVYAGLDGAYLAHVVSDYAFLGAVGIDEKDFGGPLHVPSKGDAVARLVHPVG